MTLTPIPGGGNDFAAAVELLKRNLPFILSHAKIVAQIKWATYNAYVEEGFTPEQALELCKGSNLI